MIEILFERWSQRDGSTDWLWSIWQDGERRHMGLPQQTADAAEIEARAACHKFMGKSPDAITFL